VERGEPADVILRAARVHRCDLIVTGIARNETLERLGLGTTIDQLLKRSATPLLIAKQKVHDPYSNIVVATDFSESSRHALHFAMTLFPDEILSILHAYDAPVPPTMADPAHYLEEYRKMAALDLAAFLARSSIPEKRRQDFRILLEHGYPCPLIQQLVRDQNVDLVIIGTHGRSALLNILIGSTARDILSLVPCDALVVQDPKPIAGS
jgi:nucleotide-binding universal stress UspA family protein